VNFAGETDHQFKGGISVVAVVSALSVHLLLPSSHSLGVRMLCYLC